MMKFLLLILVILFPWVVMIIEDNPSAALITLALQASIVGWIPASIWAWQEAKKGGKWKKSNQPKQANKVENQKTDDLGEK